MTMLDDDAIARYARQIVVPGIGAAGQERLLSSTVLLVGNERGCNQAQLYLRAAGARVVRPTVAPIADVEADVVVVADVASLDERTHRLLIESGKPVCWYVFDEDAFTSGVHPADPLPPPPGARVESSEHRTSAVHDAAACDAASVACAIVIGLYRRSGPFRVSI